MAPTLITDTNADITYEPTGGPGVTGPTGATGQPTRPKVLAYGTTVRPSKHAGGWRAKKDRNQKRR